MSVTAYQVLLHCTASVPLRAVRSVVARWLPARVKVPLKAAVAKVLWAGRARYCPICRSHLRAFQPFGSPVRREARCPVCGSLERHRLLWLFLRQHTDLFDGRARKILHVAPEAVLSRRISQLPGADYLSADLSDDTAMVRMDITDIQYPDESFDVIYCSHVLEHVPDDRQAMRELLRVLKTRGWAVLLVPIFAQPSFEDPSIVDPAERERAFGQHDHVRKYGPDFVDRLIEAGWHVRRFDGHDLVDASEFRRLGMLANESVFYCTRPD
jgi:SAM-dependent methyltransferase